MPLICNATSTFWQQCFAPQVAVQCCRGCRHIVGRHMFLWRVAYASPAGTREGLLSLRALIGRQACVAKSQPCISLARSRQAVRQAGMSSAACCQPSSSTASHTCRLLLRHPPAAHKQHAHARHICEHHGIVPSAADQHRRGIAACAAAFAATAATAAATSSAAALCCCLACASAVKASAAS